MPLFEAAWSAMRRIFALILRWRAYSHSFLLPARTHLIWQEPLYWPSTLTPKWPSLCIKRTPYSAYNGRTGLYDCECLFCVKIFPLRSKVRADHSRCCAREKKHRTTNHIRHTNRDDMINLAFHSWHSVQPLSTIMAHCSGILVYFICLYECLKSVFHSRFEWFFCICLLCSMCSIGWIIAYDHMKQKAIL